MVRKEDYWKNPEKYRNARKKQYYDNIEEERDSSRKRLKNKYDNDPDWRKNKLSKQKERYDSMPNKQKQELLDKNLKRWHKNYQTKYKITHDQWYEEEHKKTKENVMKLCGNGKAECVLCGSSNIDVLTIDHKNGRQGMARKTKDINRSHYGFPFWRKILNGKLNYKEYQTLCMNCNWLKHLKGLKEKKSIGRK